MVFITIDLSGITIPINAEPVSLSDDIYPDLRAKVLEPGLNELDEKFGSETWYFVSEIRMHQLQVPFIRIYMEVDDYYDYPDLTADVTQTLEKYWVPFTKTLK